MYYYNRAHEDTKNEKTLKLYGDKIHPIYIDNGY